MRGPIPRVRVPVLQEAGRDPDGNSVRLSGLPDDSEFERNLEKVPEAPGELSREVGSLAHGPAHHRLVYEAPATTPRNVLAIETDYLHPTREAKG